MGTNCASVLVLFCGLPASGKTTLVRNIRAALENRSTSARGLSWRPCVICYDELVSMDVQAEMASSKGLTKECRQHLLEAADCYIGQLCGDNFEPSHVYEDPVNEMLGRLLAATKQIQSNEKALIMVDDNLYYRSMRAAWFKLARNYSLGFCQVFLQCTVEDAIRRNASRAFSVPELTIRTMAEKFEVSHDESWEQLTIIVDGTPGCIEKVMAIIEAASRQPWSPVAASPIREKVPASQIHVWDLELRAIVSKFIRQAQGGKSSKSQVQAWSFKVQKARQDVLAYLRGLDFDNERKEMNLEELMQAHIGSSTRGGS